MVEINLLPWRMYQEVYMKNKNKKITWVTLLLLTFIAVSFYFGLTHKVKEEKSKIDYLQKQINQSAIHTSNTINRATSLQNITSQFQHNRLQLVDFFTHIIKNTDGIYWDSILTQDEHIILVGKTNSYFTLLEFVNKCETLKNKFIMDIIKIKQLTDSDVLEFSLRVHNVIYQLPKNAEQVHV